jgi:hypothetical protein
MFLEHTTKVCIVANWSADKNVAALIQNLGHMPAGGWPLTELLEYFVGFDVMINNLPEGDGRGRLRLLVDTPNGKFRQR